MGVTYPNRDRAALPAFLGRQRVRLAEIRAPVASPNGEHTKFRDDNCGADGGGHFLGGLDAQSDVSFRVPNDDNGLESCTLASAGLFLDGFDLVCYVNNLSAR